MGIIFFKHKKQFSFTRNDNKNVLLFIQHILHQSSMMDISKRANNLKTSIVFLSIHKIRHYVQQECNGNLMSLCTTGDYSHLWIQKLILSSEVKSCVS